MLFYHYTTAQNAKGIELSGMLDGSKADGLQLGWVSLTTDDDCSGHGLHDGRPVPPHLVQQVDHHFVAEVPHYFDHTEWRVVLDLSSSDLRLVRAIGHFNIVQIAGLVIAACYPGIPRVDDATVIAKYHEFVSGLLPNKAASWWYCKQPIPSLEFVRWERRNVLGSFVPDSP